MSSILAISPHLDDAVFSCGELLASAPGAKVVTVFAGGPPAGASMTSWDADCGFRADDDVIAARRGEDARALEMLGASPVWLPFWDDQYARAPALADIVAAVAPLIAMHGEDTVLFPLGLFHADHRRTREASLALLPHFASVRWLAYEDALYRRIDALTGSQLNAMEGGGFATTRVSITVDARLAARKRSAVACYASQIRALHSRGTRGHGDAFAPERYWEVRHRGALTR